MRNNHMSAVRDDVETPVLQIRVEVAASVQQCQRLAGVGRLSLLGQRQPVTRVADRIVAFLNLLREYPRSVHWRLCGG